MPEKAKGLETDVVVVGSGPGGATVARELSKKGKEVVLCEAGKYHKSIGKFYTTSLLMDKWGLTFSVEGLSVVIARTVGGLSVIYSAAAIKPPAWLKDKYGVDLEKEIDELYKEIPIQPLPDSLVGRGALKIMQCAEGLGLDWKVKDKLIRPEKCKPNCGKCAIGCTTGAKWTAREFVEEAKQNGVNLLTQTRVEKVITESGKAVGVRAVGPGGGIEIKADTVVVSAGGINSAIILQRSGLYDAGTGFLVDPVISVFGIAPKYGNMLDVPMTAGIHMAEDGILLMDGCMPFIPFSQLMVYSGLKGVAYIGKAINQINHSKLFSVIVKASDSYLHGRINGDGSISKPFDDAVKWKINKGVLIAEEILMKAGVKRKDIFASKALGGHPGGTVRLGDHLDNNCQTEITNCYCMDNSIIPEPWGLPPTVTLLAMAKRLAKHLTTG